ncbi:MAG: hypothetical protein IPO93_08575 [Actinobacteria bacterium]|nr:hypothetical protein [Actinomycetota bacterium]
MRKHPFDLLSFVAGLLFVGLALAYGIGAYTDVRLEPQYVFPLVLVVLGLAGLAGSILAQQRNDRVLASVAQDTADVRTQPLR